MFIWGFKSDRYHLLFVDSPVGTGFSSATQYATSSEEIAEDLDMFLNSFAAVHKLRGRPLIIMGESYAGHYVPALADRLLSPSGDDHPFPLWAVLIGDGMTAPGKAVAELPGLLYSLGISDRRKRKEMVELAHDGYLIPQVVHLLLLDQLVLALELHGFRCVWLDALHRPVSL